MAMQHLKDLFWQEIDDLCDAEDQILDALPEMIEAASDETLRAALEEHLDETREQRERLKELLDRHDREYSGETCEGMQGLVEEGEEVLEKGGDPDVLDAGIIAAAQRVEHYEIAAYGTARTYAQQLGDEFGADLLQETLDEESAADEKLTRIAVENVNRQAEKGVPA